MIDFKKRALEKHKALRGKLSVELKAELATSDDLSTFYSPGVGAVSSHIAEHPEDARQYTGINNSVAIISDGTAVLGLGNIGPLAALPVMEGKAMLFKRFAGIDGYPVVLDVHDVDSIVETVAAIAPSYGGINLEDIAAPQCFEIEKRLKERLAMPVMHDDQHGTAIVVLAGLINAATIVDKEISTLKIVVVGAGAAGNATANLLHDYGVKNILVLDSKGILCNGRDYLDSGKKQLIEITNPDNISGDLSKALEGADVFIGVSKANLLNEGLIKKMAKDPVIFALANPDPEITPEEAHRAGVAVIATGRSDFPNQVNNAVAFPGIFRGALDNGVNAITQEHKIKAAQVIASLVPDVDKDHIIPSVLQEGLVEAIAKEID